MSELTNTRNDHKATHTKCLATASAMALTAYIASANVASAKGAIIRPCGSTWAVNWK